MTAQSGPPASNVPGVGARTAEGAFWTIGFAVLNKAVAFASQIALAWFLLPKDVGLVGMALSITSIAALISGMNLKNVLIQRQEHFEREVGQVFWLSLLMGLTGSLLLVAAAPVAGHIFNDQRVVPLILLISISNFLGSAPAVYSAVLSRDLRFRPVATMHLIAGLTNNLGAVALAALGFGPHSLILPLIASAAFALAAHRLYAGRVVIPRPAPAQWPGLLRPAGLLMLNSMLVALFAYGANFMIGVQHNATVAGYYFWGFSIASQAVFLLAANLQGVLFPALTKLNAEPKRQSEAFRKSCLVLLVATVPMCVLQMLLAEPAIRLLFHARWLPAAGVVQALSIGLLTKAININASALLMAHGAFGALCWLTGASALLTLAAAGVAGSFGDHTTVAFAVGGVMFVMNLVIGWRALKLLNQGAGQQFKILRIPMAWGGVTLLVGAVVRRSIETSHPWWQCLIVAPLVLVLYGTGTYLMLPDMRIMLKQIFRQHIVLGRSAVN